MGTEQARSRARKLNRSLAWRALEAEKLAHAPDCECGARAVELHAVGGCFVARTAGAEVEVVALYASCHDACEPRVRTKVDRLFET